MKLAYVTVSGRGMTDDLIDRIVCALAHGGVRIAGTVRARPVDLGAHPCDMDLRVLPDGPAYRISQQLGSAARGCRLDTGTMETIAAEVEARLSGADLLIVNKFGKQEAQGRGLCPVILRAMESGIPALIGVNEMNKAIFQAFADGMAEALLPDLRSVQTWYEKVRTQRLLATT